jgi:hypothetical protein
MEAIIANEKRYLDVLDKMHSINYEQLDALRLFEFKFVDSLLRDREYLYECAKER